MSSKSTSSEVGKRQRFDELQEEEEAVLPYCELLEYYTETVRGISFGETVADDIQISSYILTYAAQTSTIPVITVRLKEDCEDKGYDTYLVQDKLFSTLKEPEIPSKILLKLQETQPNVAAIGINNSIREYRCPEWLSVRSPKGLLHDGTTSVAYYGKIPFVINCYDNGGRAAEATSSMEVIMGDRHQRLNGKRRTAHLQDTVFRTLDGLKGRFTFVKTIIIEISTECTVKELMAAAAQCIGVERMVIGIHEDGEHRFPNSARLAWHQNEDLEFNSIHPHYGDPLFPFFPFVYAISHAGNPMAGMDKDTDVRDHTSDLYNVIRENAKGFNTAFAEMIARKGPIFAKLREDPTRGHSVRSGTVIGNGGLIRVDSGLPIAAVEGSGKDTSAGVAGDDREEYTINSIYAHRFIGRAVARNLEFRVSWKGYSPRFDSWEPWSELQDCEAVDTYAFVANFTLPAV